MSYGGPIGAEILSSINFKNFIKVEIWYIHIAILRLYIFNQNLRYIDPIGMEILSYKFLYHLQKTYCCKMIKTTHSAQIIKIGSENIIAILSKKYHLTVHFINLPVVSRF